MKRSTLRTSYQAHKQAVMHNKTNFGYVHVLEMGCFNEDSLKNIHDINKGSNITQYSYSHTIIYNTPCTHATEQYLNRHHITI
jgi:hypothetical protein